MKISKTSVTFSLNVLSKGFEDIMQFKTPKRNNLIIIKTKKCWEKTFFEKNSNLFFCLLTQILPLRDLKRVEFDNKIFKKIDSSFKIKKEAFF